MPVYEYMCGKCGHVTEAIRRMADADAPINCEKCGHDKTSRELSLFNASGAASSGDAGPCGLPMGTSGGGGGCCGGGACGHHH